MNKINLKHELYDTFFHTFDGSLLKLRKIDHFLSSITGLCLYNILYFKFLQGICVELSHSQAQQLNISEVGEPLFFTTLFAF